MRRILVLGVLVALATTSALFAVDLSAGLDGIAGTTYKKDSGDSTSGLLYGGSAVVGVGFSPQMAAEVKVGVAVDDYSFGGFQYIDSYLNFVGLFKYHVSPVIFVGGGVEYNYRLSRSFDGTKTKRGDFADTDDADPGFVLITAGYDWEVAPNIVVPIAANAGFGLLNIPDDAFSLRVYATVGVRYLF